MSTILRRSSRSWMHGISRTRLPMSLWSPSSILAKYFSGMKCVYASMRMEALRLRGHWTRGRRRYMPVIKSAVQGGRNGRKRTMADGSRRPTWGRWYVLLLISLMYLITYLDRVNISTAAPVISKEFGFDKVTMGVIFSAFVWAYALFQVPGGWMGDRFGPRSMLTIIVTYWSLMTAATAAATGAVSFVIVRFLFGVGEAGAFPVATRAMQLWYAPSERGFVQGITHSASRLGAAIAPPIVVAIMTAFGWREAFSICGAGGIVWAAIWYFAYRNLPEEHALVNRGELEHIRGIDAQGNVNA